MKYFIAVLLFAVLLACSQKNDTVKLTGTIHYDQGAPTDTVYIGLYDQSNERYLGDHHALVKTLDTEFSMDVHYGFHTLSIYGREFEPCRLNLLVDEKTKHIHVDITLPRLGIPGDITEVKLKGQHNDWNPDSANVLVKDGNVWRVDDTSVIQPGQRYEFLIDGDLCRCDPSTKNHDVTHGYCSFISVYEGGDIIFDPRKYQQPQEKASVDVKGMTQIAGLEEAICDLEKIAELTLPIERQFLTLNSKDVESVYYEFVKHYDVLREKYNDQIDQMINEHQLHALACLHPTFRRGEEVNREVNGDTSLYYKWYNSQEVTDYIAGQLDLLHSLKPDCYLLRGTIASRILILDAEIESSPATRERLNLEKKHVEHYLLDFAERTRNINSAAYINYIIGSNYANSEKLQDIKYAEELMLKVKNDYPDHFLVQEGYVAQSLRRLALMIDVPAPDFSLTTCNGDTLRHDDFKGKFVLLDFWNIGCGPCRHEIPNFVKLHNTVSEDSLFILGVANDDASKLVNFIEKMKIPYTNAVATRDIITDYGVTGYPTTFLIDPDGNILKKTVRGPEVVEMVRSEMKKYYDKQSI